MIISEIGAKVAKLQFGFTQSQRLGKFFFLHCHIYFEQKNLITKHNFAIVVSVHSAKYGHSVRDTN